MAHKCVCDICGADASPEEFIVPLAKTYWAVRNGVKLCSMERIETCTLNFCGKHYRQVGGILKELQERHKREENNE